MTGRCFYYAPHHPIDLMDPLSLFPETPELCTKIFFKIFAKPPCNFQKDLLLYTSHMDDDFHQTDRGIAQLIEQRSPKP